MTTGRNGAAAQSSGPPPGGAVVPIRRGAAYTPFAEAVKDRALVIWSTTGGEDSAATERLLTAEADPGDPIPTRQTISRWARDEGWAALAAAGWRALGARRVYELKLAMFCNLLLAQHVITDVLTGAYADNVRDGVLRLKGAELATRVYERGLVAITVPTLPDDAAADDADLPRAEREALAQARITARRQEDR